MIYVALAAYNEEKNIGELLKDIYAMSETYGLETQVVVVDDGSKDNTSRVVEEFKNQSKLQVHLIQQENRGFLPALERAVRRSIELAEDDDICVTMDADHTHPANLIGQMSDQIDAGIDVVIASRFEKGSSVAGLPVHRHILSWGARLLMRRFVSIQNVQDFSCAYRAYRVGLLKKAYKAYPENLFSGGGFSGVAGMLLRLSYLTNNICEVPLHLRYDLKKGRSSLNILETIWGYIHLMRAYSKGEYRPQVKR